MTAQVATNRKMRSAKKFTTAYQPHLNQKMRGVSRRPTAFLLVALAVVALAAFPALAFRPLDGVGVRGDGLGAGMQIVLLCCNACSCVDWSPGSPAALVERRR